MLGLLKARVKVLEYRGYGVKVRVLGGYGLVACWCYTA